MATAIRLYRKFLKEYPDAGRDRISNLGAALGGERTVYRSHSGIQRGAPETPISARENELALAYYKLGRLPDAVLDLEILHNCSRSS